MILLSGDLSIDSLGSRRTSYGVAIVLLRARVRCRDDHHHHVPCLKLRAAHPIFIYTITLQGLLKLMCPNTHTRIQALISF